MRFDTDRGATPNSPEHEQERGRRQQLDYLIEQLGELAPDVPDETLREEIHRWRSLATQLPTDGRGYIENRLEELNAEYPMYRERRKDNDECFPQDCLDNCKHAQQHACPMLTDLDVKRRRRRIRAGDPTPTEYRREMKELAAEVDCHVVSDAIRVIEEYHNPIVRYGQLLLSQVQEEVVYAEQSDQLAAEIASIDLDELADDAGIDLPELDDAPVDGSSGDGDPDDDGDEPEVQLA